MHLSSLPQNTNDLLQFLRSLDIKDPQELITIYTAALNLLKDDSSSLFVFLDYINLYSKYSEVEEVEYLFSLFKVKFRKFKLFWECYLRFHVVVRKKDFNNAFVKIMEYLHCKAFEEKKEIVEILNKNRSTLEKSLQSSKNKEIADTEIKEISSSSEIVNLKQFNDEMNHSIISTAEIINTEEDLEMNVNEKTDYELIKNTEIAYRDHQVIYNSGSLTSKLSTSSFNENIKNIKEDSKQLTNERYKRENMETPVSKFKYEHLKIDKLSYNPSIIDEIKYKNRNIYSKDECKQECSEVKKDINLEQNLEDLQAETANNEIYKGGEIYGCNIVIENSTEPKTEQENAEQLCLNNTKDQSKAFTVVEGNQTAQKSVFELTCAQTGDTSRLRFSPVKKIPYRSEESRTTSLNKKRFVDICAPDQSLLPYGTVDASKQSSVHYIDFKNKHLLVINRIGKGGYSNVYKVVLNGELYALKQIRVEDEEGMNICLEEIGLLEKLNDCEYVIKMIDYEIKSDCVNILLELGEVDLMKVLKTQNMSKIYIKFLWESILRILVFIHGKRIVHRDIKPANFVLVKGQLKLIDFGISKSIKGDTTSILNLEKVGTLNYIAPEQCGGRKVTRAADVWAAGCILYYMVYRRNIHDAKHVMDVLRLMAEEREIEYKQADSDAIDSIKACLSYDPKKRAKPEELLMFPFLT